MKKILTPILAVMVIALSLPAVADAKFPDKPIRMIIPAGPGGSSDMDVRGMAPFLQKYLGVPIIIDNVVGARGIVGYNKFYRTKPDGYTLLFFNLPSPVVHELTKKTEYRTLDYTFIRGNTTKSSSLVTTYGKFKDFADFVARGKKERLKLAISGPSSDLQGFVMQDAVGLDINWIPFEGAARALSAVVGGHIDGAVIFLLRALSLAEAKKVDVPLIFTDQRDPRIPKTVTAKELGYDIPSLPVVSGVVGPPGVPADRAKVIEDAIARLPKEPKYMEWAQKNGVVVESFTSEKFKAVADNYYKVVQKYKHLFK